MDPRKQRGDAAEALAVEILIDAGYRIVDRNVRCRLGELDVVARDGSALVFVEVRMRSDDAHGGAARAIGREKQRRVIRMARFYLSGLAHGANREADRPPFSDVRFDVVAITAGQPVLFKDAFRVH